MTADLLDAEVRLEGEVVGVYHADPATGFGVVEVQPSDGSDGARCAGPLADVVEGQLITVVGRWRDHPRFGPTLEAVYYEQRTPTTVAGLQTFLASDRFAEVGDAAIAAVLARFGSGTGRIIEREPDRLSSEAGLDDDAADALRDAWMRGRALAALVRLVEPIGWPMEVVRSAHRHFGADVAEIAQDDPYRLIEADRVRFAHVDPLGRRCGIAGDDPRRLAAGVRSAVVTARAQGHEHLPRPVLIQDACRVLGVDAVLAAEGIDVAVADASVVAEELDGVEVFAVPAAAQTEQKLADDLARLLDARSRLRTYADSIDASGLTDEQADAVRSAFAAPVSILTGGPGTGKTTAVSAIVDTGRRAGINFALCAPTGRAAKRLEDLAGSAATTVHRLLEASGDPDGGFRFRFGATERLPHDLVVVDEVSMCDTALAAHLVSAVEEGSHLVLVGDPDQLPSVGPGDVLRSLMASGHIPVSRLETIHRQAHKSRIVRLAHEVLAGGVGPMPPVEDDVFMAEEADPSAIVARVVRAVAERAPERFGVDSGDVQVLAPVYRGPTGVDALNTALKRALNPGTGRPGPGGFDVGDRVMQTRNDAELDLANGDMGVVVDTDRGAGIVRVAFPRGEASIQGERVRDLVPAWAVTVHKAQGGQWPVVVLVCDTAHRGMLWRNLVYTGVTRAARALVIVGQSERLRAAARADRPSQRHTGLTARLARAVDNA